MVFLDRAARKIRGVFILLLDSVELRLFLKFYSIENLPIVEALTFQSPSSKYNMNEYIGKYINLLTRIDTVKTGKKEEHIQSLLLDLVT